MKSLSVSAIILAVNNKEKPDYDFFCMTKGDQESKTGQGKEFLNWSVPEHLLWKWAFSTKQVKGNNIIVEGSYRLLVLS